MFPQDLLMLPLKPQLLQYEFVLFTSARDKFSIDPWVEVYLVLEEDGTEVDDEEYFQVDHDFEVDDNDDVSPILLGSDEMLNQQKAAISADTSKQSKQRFQNKNLDNRNWIVSHIHN